MRTCKHCAHQSANHLAFCAACGHWLGTPTSGMSAFGRLGGNGTDRARGTAAFSRTMVAAPSGSITGRSTGRSTGGSTGPLPGETTTNRALAAQPKRGLSWAGDAIGYIYIYLRDKVDAGARRRRLAEERTGAEALLSGALNELAATVLREGVQHPDFTGLLEAIGRAHARREAAAGISRRPSSFNRMRRPVSAPWWKRPRVSGPRTIVPAATPTKFCGARRRIATPPGPVWPG